MFDEKAIIGMIAASSQEECREMGELFMSFVDRPRDVHWKAQFRRQLEQFPEARASDLATAISEANKRVRTLHDDLWSKGWHPIQMHKKLVELGYTGLTAEAAGPVPIYELQRYSDQRGPY